MYCPKDNSKLIAYTVHGFEIDVCEKCHGVWYDQDEFGGLLKNLAHWELPEEYQVISSPKPLSERGKAKTRICPRDGSLFSTYQYASNSRIHIDRCPQCNGIWLDGGELYQIREHLKTDPTMEKLAQAIVEHHQSSEELREMITHAPFVLLAPLYFIPYGTTLHLKRFPWLTVSLIGVSIAIFFRFIFLPEIEEVETFFQTFGFLPALASMGSESYRFFTHLFLHGDIFHLFGNMLFLWVFGRNLEERFGTVKYALLFFFSGIVAALTHTMLHQNDMTLAVGASGAISGILGGYFLLFPSSRIKAVTFNFLAIVLGARKGLRPVIKVPAWYYLGAWFVLQFLFAFLYYGVSNIAFFAHVGGFIGGFLLAKLLYIFKLA